MAESLARSCARSIAPLLALVLGAGCVRDSAVPGYTFVGVGALAVLAGAATGGSDCLEEGDASVCEPPEVEGEDRATARLAAIGIGAAGVVAGAALLAHRPRTRREPARRPPRPRPPQPTAAEAFADDALVDSAMRDIARDGLPAGVEPVPYLWDRGASGGPAPWCAPPQVRCSDDAHRRQEGPRVD